MTKKTNLLLDMPKLSQEEVDLLTMIVARSAYEEYPHIAAKWGWSNEDNNISWQELALLDKTKIKKILTAYWGMGPTTPNERSLNRKLGFRQKRQRRYL